MQVFTHCWHVDPRDWAEPILTASAGLHNKIMHASCLAMGWGDAMSAINDLPTNADANEA